MTNRSRGPRRRGRGGAVALPPPAPSLDEVRGVRGWGAGRGGGEGGQKDERRSPGATPAGPAPLPAPGQGGQGIRGWRCRGGWGGAAAAATRGSAVQSSAHGAAGSAASATGKLKGKGDDRVTRPARGGAPSPGPGACLGPPPKSSHPEQALSLRPERSRRGTGPAQPSLSGGARSPRPSLLPHPGSSRGRSRLPLPARTPLHPPRAKPQSAPQLGMVSLQRPQGPGAHQREEAGLPRVWALGLFSWDTPWLPPSVFTP